MSDIQAWRDFALKLGRKAYDIAGSAKITMTQNGFSSEHLLAVALLSRTASNLKGVIILSDHRRLIEARTLARSCFENLYWTMALAKDGDKFVSRMEADEMKHKRQRGQAIFESQIALEADVEDRLRAWMKDTKARWDKAETLSPKDVSKMSSVANTYMLYGQLSADAHPSVTALNRYVESDQNDEIIGLVIEPDVTDDEIVDTLHLGCLAALGVCTGANEILGGTTGGARLGNISDDMTALTAQTRPGYKPPTQV